MKVKGIEIPEREMRKDPKLWIQNCIRINNGLGDKDYQLLLEIDKQKQNDDWCYMTKEILGGCIGLSRSNLIVHLNKLITKGFVIRNSYIPRMIRLKPKWYIEQKKYRDTFIQYVA